MTKLNTENEQQKTSGDLRNHNVKAMLYGFVERVERLTEEINGLTDDRKEVFSEAKGCGFDTKILREVIRRRKLDTADRVEHDSLLETYEDAIRQAEREQTEASRAEGE